MKNQESTIDDVLGAIADFADTTEKRFGVIDKRFDKIESDITTIKATMVTKDYLDRKLSDVRADVVAKVDKKDTSLVETLQKKKIISASERDGIVAMSPFPHLAA